MSKEIIISLLLKKYGDFADYINSLPEQEYLRVNKLKWSAKEQLNHIILCVKPLIQVFSLDKQTIEQSFGKTDRQSRYYDELTAEYLDKLQEGGKAPEKYLPETNTNDERTIQCETLTNLVNELVSKIETFSEEELDHLLIPHPLLGKLTLREMLYNAIYHVQHHQKQTIDNLKAKK